MYMGKHGFQIHWLLKKQGMGSLQQDIRISLIDKKMLDISTCAYISVHPEVQKHISNIIMNNNYFMHICDFISSPGISNLL